jgi:hypothetical protein
MTMAKNFPTTIPHPYDKDETLSRAYRMGWDHGHGFACHNVPRLGDKLFVEDMGRVTVDAENIREVHASQCYSAESNSRQFSPFEFTAHAFNNPAEFTGLEEEDCEGISEELWEAFEAGTADAIQADLADYTDEDYGIETEEEEA